MISQSQNTTNASIAHCNIWHPSFIAVADVCSLTHSSVFNDTTIIVDVWDIKWDVRQLTEKHFKP
jgi:hypothetical protein